MDNLFRLLEGNHHADVRVGGKKSSISDAYRECSEQSRSRMREQKGNSTAQHRKKENSTAQYCDSTLLYCHERVGRDCLSEEDAAVEGQRQYFSVSLARSCSSLKTVRVYVLYLDNLVTVNVTVNVTGHVTVLTN